MLIEADTAQDQQRIARPHAQQFGLQRVATAASTDRVPETALTPWSAEAGTYECDSTRFLLSFNH